MNHFYALFVTVLLSQCALSPASAQTPEKATPQHAPELKGNDNRSNPFTNIPPEIKELLLRARTMVNVEPEGAIVSARRALKLARRYNNAMAESYAHEVMGKACEAMNDSIGATAQYAMQARSAAIAESPEGMVAARLNQARALCWRQCYDSAFTVLHDAEREATLAGFTATAGDIKYLMGEVRYREGQYNLAWPYYSIAADHYLAMNDSARYYDALMGAANSLHYASQYELALPEYLECLQYRIARKDSLEIVKLHNNIGGVFSKLGKYGDAVVHFQAGVAVATGLQRNHLIAACRVGLGEALFHLDYLSRSVDESITALKLANKVHDASKREDLKATIYANLGAACMRLGDYEKSMRYYLDEEKIREERGDIHSLAATYYNIAEMLFYKYKAERSAAEGDLSAAERYYNKSLAINREIHSPENSSLALSGLSRIALHRGEKQRALDWALSSLRLIERTGARSLIGFQHGELGIVYDSIGRYQSALHHFHEALSIGTSIASNELIQQASHGLAHTYALLGTFDSAFYFSDLHAHIQDSIRADKQNMQAAATEAMYQAEQHARALIGKEEELKFIEESNQAQKIMLGIGAGAFVLVCGAAVVAFIGYRGRKQAYERLKATQEQLLVQEKLASLGQLTAGIAHEIQNPLNFVNNFSEMTHELAAEAQEEIIDNPALTDAQKYAQLTSLLSDIKSNSRHVSDHGKRASSIVNQMLQHARSDTGETVDVDLNKLLGEMADLAYHGMRARYKGMAIDMESEFSGEDLIVHVGAQALGRVFVNILNNAFDAVIERAEREDDFRPSVLLSTRREGNNAEIRIRDNGPGIPRAIRDKIFEPFYTTKPSGKGTGLGLSLSHDIVAKNYGGVLRVESKPGDFTEFVISLPLKRS